MRRSLRLAATAGVAYAAAGPALADSAEAVAGLQGPYAHVGPGALLFHPGAKVVAGGMAVPGADVRIGTNLTGIVEVGYRWGGLGASLTIGAPPRARVVGSGSLAPVGTLGSIRYGPAVLSAHYHFAGLGRFQPYLGGGPVFLLVFKDRDAAVGALDVRDHLGVAGQVGPITRLPAAGRCSWTSRRPTCARARSARWAACRSRPRCGWIPPCCSGGCPTISSGRPPAAGRAGAAQRGEDDDADR